MDSSTLTLDWSLELASDHPVASFAACELQRMLQRIAGLHLPIVAQASGPRLALRCGPDGDGFGRGCDSAGLILHGDGPRGLLYAVYDLLESLGCAWVSPDPAGEHIPHYEHVVLPTQTVTHHPALAGRCLVIGHDFFLDTAADWIIWAARNRLNTIFIHTIDQRLALGACHLRRWRTLRHRLLPLLHERGMQLELGGHGLSGLIPRRLFRIIPQLFRHNGQRRVPDHNFCPQHPVTRQLLRTQSARFFRRYPEAQIFHLWPDDLRGGGWCHCPRCSQLTPADQSLLATNELADVLATINPHARLGYLAYHDTSVPPTHVVPRTNLVLTYAPRLRSYAHGIAVPTSAINVSLMRHLQAYLQYFHAGVRSADQRDHPHATPADPLPAHRVFEYYLDGILFKSAPPPLSTVLQSDLCAYRQAGVHTVQALMTGDRPWLTAPVNAYLFARLAWNPDQDPQALLQTYATVRASHAAPALMASYQALTAAWQPVLDFTPEEQGACAAIGSSRRDPVAHPPQDILDYMTAPLPIRERRLELFASVEKYLAEGQAAWATIREQAYTDWEQMMAAYAEWQLGALLLRYIVLRQRLYVLAAQHVSPVTLRAALLATQHTLDSLVTWGQQHLYTGRAQANYRLFRLVQQLHLDTVYDRHLAAPWQRIWVRVRAYYRLAWYLWRLMRNR